MAAERQALPIAPAEADRLLAPFAGTIGIGLAVSGGADSIALMRLAAEWGARHRPDLPVIVLTVDHGLRAGSADEARQVGAWARAAGLDHAVLTREGPAPTADIQAAAREARYRLLAQACTARGLSHLVTAHHLDDQAETFLLRLARGSGVDGLSAMALLADWPGLKVARPLLDVAKSRLVATLVALGQPWIEDPSNVDDRFARARMRRLMPVLAAEGLTAERMAATARRMRRAREALESAAGDLHRAAVAEDGAGFCRLDVATFAGAPEEIGLRVLARLLMGIGGSVHPPRLERLERLYGLLAGRAGDTSRAMTLSGCRVAVVGGTATFCREAGRTGLPVAALDAAGLVWDRRFRIEAGPGHGPTGGGGGVGETLTVRALGADGVAAVRSASRLRDLPSQVARVAPGIFAGARLVAAPLVEAGPGPFSPPGFRIAFVGGARFATGPAGAHGE